MGKINPLVAIGIPTWGKVSIEWARAYRHLGGPLGASMIELPPVVGKPIAAARNELMQMAIQQGADFLFFLGDDNLPGGDAIIRLLQRMWDNPDVHLATGVYWTKGFPTQPYLWRGMQRGPYLDWKLGEWFPVDFAGCDSLLIRLSPEIKALGPEWFSTTWLWEPEQDRPSELATEDFYFYTKARRAGLRLWCDADVQVLHQDRQSGMMFGLTYEMPQAGAAPVALPAAGTDAAPLVRVADIGCGVTGPFFGHADQVQVVRFDGNEKVQPDYRCDLRQLPVPDQSFDVVHSRHVIEHFGRAEVMRVLHEWTRILRVGGEFRISCPNLLAAIERIKAMDAGDIGPDPYPWWQVYGEQADPYDFHRNGFTVRRMRLLLESLGIFDQIEVMTGDGDGDMNVYAKAVKVRHPQPWAFTPEWHEIERQEGIIVPGLQRPEPEAPAITVEAQPDPRRTDYVVIELPPDAAAVAPV